MKRMLILPLLAAVILSLTACGGPHPDNTATPVTAGFSCDASIQYREMALEAHLSRQVDGKLLVEFSLPKSLSGITLGWDGKDMTMEMAGMQVVVPAEKVPQGALLRRLLEVLAEAHEEGSVTDEGYVVTGQIEETVYTLVCDPATGYPITLSLPEEALEATFTNVTALA